MTDAQEAGKMASEPNVSGECDLCALSPCMSDAENGWHISKVTGSRFRCTAAPTAAPQVPRDDKLLMAAAEIRKSHRLDHYELYGIRCTCTVHYMGDLEEHRTELLMQWRPGPEPSILGLREAAPTAAAESAPPDLNDAIAAIEEIVGSEELEEWGLEKANGKLSERELAMYERLSKAYQISHAFNPKHSCYKVHEDWRRLARAALQGEPGGEK